jgi:hypothetical protein
VTLFFFLLITSRVSDMPGAAHSRSTLTVISGGFALDSTKAEISAGSADAHVATFIPLSRPQPVPSTLRRLALPPDTETVSV